MDVDRQGLSYPRIAGYRIGEEIGGGGFSKVFRAIDDEHSRVAACKVVNLFVPASLGYGVPNIKELQKEVQVHKSLHNTYILEFLHHEIIDQNREKDGIVPGLYMLLELAVGGDLFDKIAPDVGIPEDLAKFYFAQLVAGMEHIHSKGIAHRDVKPENLLLAANGNLKITDFGLCAVFKYKGKERLLSGRCGSLPYVAPELGASGGYAAEPVDIWGMGIVLFTMLVGNTPWDEPVADTSVEFRTYVQGGIWDYHPWTKIRGQTQELMLQLLEIDPRKRITISGIKSHSWCMTPSQLSREQLPEALTQGLRQTGMMAVADPTFTDHNAQAYAASRSQRVFGESQWGTQWNQQESQFMRATGNLTQGGDFDNVTTRFWLKLDPANAFTLLHEFLCAELEATNVQANSTGTAIRVRKAAGQKSVTGTFFIKSSDTHATSGQTLVSMRREKGSALHWRAFWWATVRNQHIEPYVLKGE